MIPTRVPGWACVVAVAALVFGAPEASAQQPPPTIKYIDPAYVQCGQEHEIHIFGSNLLPGSQVEVWAEGVSVHQIEYVNREEIWVWVFIPEQTPPGAATVALFGENGEARLEEALTVICEGIPEEPGGGGVVPPDPDLPGGEEPPPDGEPPYQEPPGEPPVNQPPDAPLPPYQGPPAGPNWLLILLIGVVLGTGAIGALLAVTLSVRAIQKRRRRRWWEQKASQEHPPDQCQARQWYCEVDPPELHFRRSRLTEIRMSASEATTRQRQQDKALHGRPIGELDRVFLMSRMGRPVKDFEHEIVTVADWMAQEIGAWLREVQSQQCVELAAHFEGVEIEQQFTLYRCVQKGPKSGWQEVDEWEISHTAARDVPMGSYYPQPADPVRSSGELASLLTQFIRTS